MDTDKIQSILKMFENSQISKMDLTDGKMHIILEKNQVVDAVLNQSFQLKEEKQENEDNQGIAFKSPLVGTFYAASGEGKEPFVKVGDYVHKGDTLCIIEAMKVMNEISSDVDGRVVSIEVKNGQSVEFDQVLMRIEGE